MVESQTPFGDPSCLFNSETARASKAILDRQQCSVFFKVQMAYGLIPLTIHALVSIALMIQIIKMQIGHLFKVDKLKMEYVLIIIMDLQQDNAFK